MVITEVHLSGDAFPASCADCAFLVTAFPLKALTPLTFLIQITELTCVIGDDCCEGDSKENDSTCGEDFPETGT